MNAALPADPAAAGPKVWTVAIGRIADWMRRERRRETLAGLNARERLDMGLPRAAVEKQLRRAHWRA